MIWIILIYAPLISVAVVSGLFIMALINFSTIRKNMQLQSEPTDKKFENPKRAADIF